MLEETFGKKLRCYFGKILDSLLNFLIEKLKIIFFFGFILFLNLNKRNKNFLNFSYEIWNFKIIFDNS